MKHQHRDHARLLISRDKIVPLKIPCPICGGKLTVECGDAWEQEENGDWIATEIRVDCTTEPSIDSNDWQEWFNWHFRMPYIDWLPLELKVLREFQNKFRFEIEF